MTKKIITKKIITKKEELSPKRYSPETYAPSNQEQQLFQDIWGEGDDIWGKWVWDGILAKLPNAAEFTTVPNQGVEPSTQAGGTNIVEGGSSVPPTVKETKFKAHLKSYPMPSSPGNLNDSDPTYAEAHDDINDIINTYGDVMIFNQVYPAITMPTVMAIELDSSKLGGRFTQLKAEVNVYVAAHNLIGEWAEGASYIGTTRVLTHIFKLRRFPSSSILL
jgi:hypothetical protein